MSVEEFRDWGKEHIEEFKKISSILNQFNDIYNEELSQAFNNINQRMMIVWNENIDSSGISEADAEVIANFVNEDIIRFTENMKKMPKKQFSVLEEDMKKA